MAKKIERRTPSVLASTLYCYVEPTNKKRAIAQGVAKFGSFSNYVNFLIAQDHKDKASMARSQAIAAKSTAPRKDKPKSKKKSPAKKSKRQAKGKMAKRRATSTSQTQKSATSRKAQSTRSTRSRPRLKVNHVKKVLKSFTKAMKKAKTFNGTTPQASA